MIISDADNLLSISSLLISVLSPSPHQLATLQWCNSEGQPVPSHGNIFVGIMAKYDKIASFSGLGMTLLARVEELMMRITEIGRVLNSSSIKERSHVISSNKVALIIMM